MTSNVIPVDSEKIARTANFAIEGVDTQDGQCGQIARPSHKSVFVALAGLKIMTPIIPPPSKTGTRVDTLGLLKVFKRR